MIKYPCKACFSPSLCVFDTIWVLGGGSKGFGARPANEVFARLAPLPSSRCLAEGNRILIWAIFGAQTFGSQTPPLRDVLERPYTIRGGGSPPPRPPHHTFLSKKGLEELSAIQEHMVVTYADKSAHDFVTCCKHMYKKLLWTELHSPHYANTARSSDEIYSKHQTLSTQIGRPAVQAHRYLYGILKMHKATVGMRWIAGNHMQAIEGPLEHGAPKKMPACSLSPVETAMGNILRMCVHNLESKDRSYRQKGYKRYWVVTNVDRVAADIKTI